MGNNSSRIPTPFACLMSKRFDVGQQKWMAFSDRMNTLDGIWPQRGSCQTKALRGLVERQTGHVAKSDVVLLQCIEQLVQERESRTAAQAARTQRRLEVEQQTHCMHKNVAELCTQLTHLSVALRQAPVHANTAAPVPSQDILRPQPGPSQPQRGEMCYNCGEIGHWRGVCPTPRRRGGKRGRGRGCSARHPK